MRNQEEIKEILGIPDFYIPISILAVGWPDESPKPKYRRPLREITFMNRYGEPVLERMLDKDI